MNQDRRAIAAPTLELAAWVAALRHADVPEDTRVVIRKAVLDTLGCGLHGRAYAWTKHVGEWAAAGSGYAPGKGQARVWGETAPQLRTADAALVNGVAAHAFELDDYHNAKLHPGAAVIPAALAVAEHVDADGTALLTAISAGYEAMIRASLALEPSATRLRGWHLTGICGPFGAAAACAKLLGLDAERTAWALGLAGTQGAGLWAFTADGAMSKRFHAGKAAHSGVLAAELAARGFSGPTQIFEAQDGGYLKAFSDAGSVAPLTHELGSHWHAAATAIKPYACCGSSHAYVDAALALRAKLGAPWDMKRPVRAGLARVVQVQCGFDYVPSTPLVAQMNLRYIIARTLLDGEAQAPQFTGDKLADPQALALARHIELVEDPALDKLYPVHFAGWIEAAAAPGQAAERVSIKDPTGSAAAPIAPAALKAKFAASNPSANVARIADIAFALERHRARALLDAAAD
jgi:2-methylcitrate dehydratase PrpD